MLIENKLDSRSFGPFGSSTGLFMFLIGLIFSYFNLAGLILATIGAFIAFTSTGTIIDTETRRIKHADYLFGLFPIGKWVYIRPGMKLGLKEVKRGYVGYIRANQPMEIRSAELRIFLFDSSYKRIMPIKKIKPDTAEAELGSLSLLLKLETINFKK
jgi:hypothetical protein